MIKLFRPIHLCRKPTGSQPAWPVASGSLSQTAWHFLQAPKYRSLSVCVPSEQHSKNE